MGKALGLVKLRECETPNQLTPRRRHRAAGNRSDTVEFQNRATRNQAAYRPGANANQGSGTSSEGVDRPPSFVATT